MFAHSIISRKLSNSVIEQLLHLVTLLSHQPHFSLILYLNGSREFFTPSLLSSLFVSVDLKMSHLLGRQSFGSPHSKPLIGIFRKLFHQVGSVDQGKCWTVHKLQNHTSGFKSPSMLLTSIGRTTFHFLGTLSPSPNPHPILSSP